jgi:three-Cys-motif partner protein
VTDECKLDPIGPWSEVKLEIVKEYARPYSLIMTRQGERYPNPFKHFYIDAFAGVGKHMSRTKNEIVDGSPRIVLDIDPPFCEYHFVDIDNERVQELEKLKSEYFQKKIYVHSGDANRILVNEIFPMIGRERYGKGLCLLDPYGLHLNWCVVKAAGMTGKIEIFLNFPIMDMQRNVFYHDRNNVEQKQLLRMNEFWGDESWQDLVWGISPQLGFFEGSKEEKSKWTERNVVEGYRQRLLNTAGFSYAPDPIPMINSKKSVIYYLFFASPNKTGNKIARGVLKKWREKGFKYG